MTGFIRRVVTGHDDQGRSIVLSDGLAPKLHANPLRLGHRSTETWKTTAMPVPISRTEPEPTLGPRTIRPAPGGTVIRIAEIGPETDAIRDLPADKSRELFKSMGNETASTYGRGGRHPMMHRSESIDYVVVLEGEMTLLLDDQEVLLKTGDVVVQRGTNHAWSNRSGKVARMLYVLIDGCYDPELAAVLGHKPSADEVR